MSSRAQQRKQSCFITRGKTGHTGLIERWYFYFPHGSFPQIILNICNFHLIAKSLNKWLHFRPLRICSMPHCSFINSPLPPWIYTPTIQLSIMTLMYYSISWYHSFMLFCMSNLCLIPIYLTQYSYSSFKTQFRHYLLQ